MGVLRVRSTAVPRQSLRSIFRANRRGAAAIIDGIAVPWQCPPQIFIDAVLVCPPITGMAYERALLGEWRPQSGRADGAWNTWGGRGHAG